MAVSGTYNFNLDIDQVIQEAMEMIGGEQTLGHEPASARRSINLMLKDWQKGSSPVDYRDYCCYCNFQCRFL